MTKPTKWVCSQQRLRSAWAFRHSPSLIRVFVDHIKKAWVLSYPLSAQRRHLSDWADAQADPSLHWPHSHFVGFVMSQLKCSFLFFQLTGLQRYEEVLSKLNSEALKRSQTQVVPTVGVGKFRLILTSQNSTKMYSFSISSWKSPTYIMNLRRLIFQFFLDDWNSVTLKCHDVLSLCIFLWRFLYHMGNQ